MVLEVHVVRARGFGVWVLVVLVGAFGFRVRGLAVFGFKVRG